MVNEGSVIYLSVPSLFDPKRPELVARPKVIVIDDPRTRKLAAPSFASRHTIHRRHTPVNHTMSKQPIVSVTIHPSLPLQPSLERKPYKG